LKFQEYSGVENRSA